MPEMSERWQEMSVDLDELARYLINEWGDYVKVDDMPDELIPVFAIQTLRQAQVERRALRGAIIEASTLLTNAVLGRESLGKAILQVHKIFAIALEKK